MNQSHRKELFSAAYIKAVVSVAGFTMSRPDLDLDSVDWTIADRGWRGTVRSPKLDVQLKCTSSYIPDEMAIAFPLKKKNYDDLQGEGFQSPRILVVVVVPEDIEKWLQQDETALVMNHCGYWLSLLSFPPSTNASSVTVYLPRSNLFTVEALNAMMKRIGNKGFP